MNSTRAGWLSIGVAAILAVAAQPSFAQPGPTFDAVSVKPNPSGDGGGSVNTMGVGRFNAGNVSLRSLILFALDVRYDQVTGGPNWLDTQKYDVIAKADGLAAGGDEALRPMVKSLLEDRFKLKFHRETKELSVYSLVVAKGGPKLTEHTGDKGFMQTMAGFGRGMTGTNYTKATMSALVEKLGRTLGRSVIDNTGLRGEYDFKLEWARSPDSDTGPSIFTALQEQLGLKLESAKGPVEMIVIDGAEKASAN